jgi:hypothetical protein
MNVLLPSANRCKWFMAAWLIACWAGLNPGWGSEIEGFSAGPAYDRFELTLDPGGERTEVAGPLYYQQDRPEDFIWALPPFFCYATNKLVDSDEMDFLYPLWTYDRFGDQKRWQFFQIFNQSFGHFQDETIRSKLTLFPFFFSQRSTDPDQNYTALWPLFGQLNNRLYYQEIQFVLWPVWVKTRRAGSVARTPEDEFIAPFFRWREERRVDVTTYNVLAPFFHYREGPDLKGWQALPLFSWERKGVSRRLDKWGDEELVPGFRHLTVLWPLFFSQDRKLGTPNEEKFRALLPLFSILRSPYRDSSSYLWPIGLTLTEDRARHYREVGAPWPFIVFSWGEGKTTTRVWPFYSHAQNSALESRFLLWPLYKYNAIHAETLDRRRSRLLFFLYSNTIEENKATGDFRRRRDLWPLFTHSREMDGRQRLQVLAPLEPFLPNIDSIPRDYSPLWSIWRAESNPATATSSHSLLWNLYRRTTSPGAKKCSLFFGLFQYQSGSDRSRLRLFYIPLGGGAARPTSTEVSAY